MRAQPWLNSSMCCSAKRLVYNGNLTQKGKNPHFLPQWEDTELLEGDVSFHRVDGTHCSHATLVSLSVRAVLRKSCLLPALGRGLVDFVGFQVFSVGISEGRSHVMFMANVSVAWLIS